MNDITTYQNNAPAPAQGYGNAPIMPAMPDIQENTELDKLVKWAQAAQAVAGLAQGLANSLFVPKEFQGKPDNVTAAILRGASLGLDPMQSVNVFDVIHGRPSIRARAMSAIVIGKGHELIRTVATEQQVTYQARRKGKEQWQEFTYTMERAARQGLTSNALYKSNPIAMLTAKTIAEACRVVFPDVIEGIDITEEVEAGEYSGAPAGEPVAEAPKKRVQRKPRPKKEPEPVHVAEAPEEPAEDSGEAMSKEQTDAVFTLGQTWGVSSAEEMNTRLSEVLGEAVTFDTLTAAQADRVLTSNQ